MHILDEDKHRIDDIWHACNQTLSSTEDTSPLSTFKVVQLLPKGFRLYTDSFYPVKPGRGSLNEIFFGEEERRLFFQIRCLELFEVTCDPATHFSRLDEALSKFLIVKIKTPEPKDVALEKALALLARMPPTPSMWEGCIQLTKHHRRNLDPYCLPPSTSTNNLWETLEVVARPATNTFRSVFNFVCEGGDFWRSSMYEHWERVGFDPERDPRKSNPAEFWNIQNLTLYTNILAELLETACRLHLDMSIGDESTEVAARWHVIESFLWVSWQRSALLVQWFQIEKATTWGYSIGSNFLRGTGKMQDWVEMERNKSEYMSVDLRHFHARLVSLNNSDTCLHDAQRRAPSAKASRRNLVSDLWAQSSRTSQLIAPHVVGNAHGYIGTNSITEAWMVHVPGRVDLVVLFQHALHLLPPGKGPEDVLYPGKFVDDRYESGFVSIQEAASLLSHRQASRKGDDVVIWSLLVDEKPQYSAEELWLSRRDWRSRLIRDPTAHPDTLNTGFLFSSAPRLRNIPGLGWAPASPTYESTTNNFFLGNDGNRTKFSNFDEDGLKAIFAVHIFWSDMGVESHPYQLAVKTCLKEQYALENSYHRWIALLHPLLEEFIYPPTAYRYRGNSGTVGNPLFGVCVSNDNAKENAKWMWKGVYLWDSKHSLPDFWEDELLLV
ncbi:MAG: hypothetical protein Q9165_000421 [Trypethelium subeluteriae]